MEQITITYYMIMSKLEELNQKRQEFLQEVNKQNAWFIDRVRIGTFKISEKI